MTPNIIDWLKFRREVCGLECRLATWGDLDSWYFQDGYVVHKTKGFFSLVGLRGNIHAESVCNIEQPIISQPEIGILGFILRRVRGRVEILLQAKTEPGNIGSVQLAPSVQATFSNYTRRHGGAPTPHIEYFLEPDAHGQLLADSLQSEQGTRFLGKYNRNATILAGMNSPEPVSDCWRWFGVEKFLPMLQNDFFVNTDARSVLVCSDWRYLAVDGQPFERWRGAGGFGEMLLESFNSGNGDKGGLIDGVINFLEHARSCIRIQTEVRPLTALSGWVFHESGISDLSGTRFKVCLMKVKAPDREVSIWDQPLLENYQIQTAVLFCQIRDGILCFLLRGSAEIGFRERVQFGPTIQTDGVLDKSYAYSEFVMVTGNVKEHVSVWQSDEGGRFNQCKTHYRVVEIPESEKIILDELSCWVTLAQLYALLKHPSMLNNEMRSALSLLIPYI